MDVFQSGFRPLHSTESSLLRVFNDIFMATDSGSYAVLLLLDLSAAFHTVDHDILLLRLEEVAAIRGPALTWFRSYLSNRSQRVVLNNISSRSAPLSCGVPQGSILGPLLFCLYLLPLSFILKKYCVQYHLYADDCQIYMSVKPQQSIQPLLDCLRDVKCWLATNFLHLNDSNTELILFNPVRSTVSRNLKTVVTNLGVKMDSSLRMDAQVNATVKSCFFQLRRLSKLRAVLSRNNLESVVHAFITSRLDYSNAILLGVNKSTLARLQLIQNAAARSLTRTDRRQRITPVLKSLHWLPITFRVQYKILLFVFKSLHGLAPVYLSDLLSIYTPGRSLRSSSLLLLEVPKACYKSCGQSVAGPKLWNELPVTVRLASTLADFKSRLKTHYFTLAFNS
uniref:Reverse transcriptase domain-containing protein n=1 Tax=Nothobranchius furzeri TaxID=105023 RepID=A0A8C6NWF0_NOTFU